MIPWSQASVSCLRVSSVNIAGNQSELLKIDRENNIDQWENNKVMPRKINIFQLVVCY